MKQKIDKSTYILALGSFGIVTTEFSVIGVLPDLIKRFHISVDMAGWLLSGFALAVAIGGPFMNILLSRFNKKFVMCLAQSVFIICNLISTIAPSFTVMMIVRVVSALFHPVFWGAALTMATKDLEPKLAPKALSIVIAGISIATVFGVPLSTYMADLFNYRASFYLGAAINLFALVSLIIGVPSMSAVSSDSKQPTAKIKILARKDVWLRIITSVVILSGMFASYGYLGEYLTKVSKLNGRQLSLLLFLFGGAGLIGNWLTGIALSKGVRNAVRLHLVLLTIIQLLAFVFGGNFWMLMLVVPLWGLVHAGGFLTGNVHIVNEVHGPGLDFLNGVVPSIFNAGIALGTLLGGFAIANYGTKNMIWMSVVLLVLALAMTFIRTKTKQNTPDPTK